MSFESFEYHGITIWVILFWLAVTIISVLALIFIEREYRENTRDYKKNANPLCLNELPDKENEQNSALQNQDTT
jgi:hypothetical protein